MRENKTLTNPKKRTSFVGKGSWYYYYAGYSDRFVKDALEHLSLSRNAVIADPWNGSGTTTQIAREMGFKAVGYDINPVMIIVAKSRLLDSSVNESLESILEDVLDKSLNRTFIPPYAEEPLNIWLDDTSAYHIRKIEMGIQYLLISPSKYRVLFKENSLSFISSLAAFFYVALFRTLKEILIPFKSSNPTWIKVPKQQSEHITISEEIVDDIFRKHVKEMKRVLATTTSNSKSYSYKTALIDIGKSTSIPYPDASIDAVVTSPPYCTRIDYVIATRPELAVLGCNIESETKYLRNQMTGTPTVLKNTPEKQESWGFTCNRFLNAVEHHSAKASKSYYMKTFLQYFTSIYNSFSEINRILSEKGNSIFVIQDSYYKEVHINLPEIFCEFGDSIGWKVDSRSDYYISQTIAGVNRGSMKYRSRASAVESVIVFSKR